MKFFYNFTFSFVAFCKAFQPMNVKFKFNNMEFDKVNKYIDNSLDFYDKVIVDKLKDEKRKSQTSYSAMNYPDKKHNKQNKQKKRKTKKKNAKKYSEKKKEDIKLLCHQDFLDAKSYLVKNLDNKYIKYIGLYNITNADSPMDEEFIFQNTSPLIFVFIKIVPIINTISVEGILPNIYKNERDFNKNIIPISKAYLFLLSKQSQLILDYHNLKYFADGKYFLEFVWHESESD
tara:strand:- start:349 stop:1044 length:696 start_codon:yes stop_codon:yes gene_type:complete